MGLPCSRALDCWYIYFQVVDHLRQELSAEEWQEAFEKPVTSKIISLSELIEKAQKLSQKKGPA